MDPCRVQAVGRLVQDQQRRSSQESFRQSQPLLHSKRIFAGQPFSEFVETCKLQGVFDAVLRQPQDPADNVQIFFAGEIPIEGGRFDKGPCLPEDFSSVFGIRKPLYLKVAAGRAGKPKEHFHGRRFSRSIWSQKSIDLAFLHMHVQLIYCGKIPVSFCEIMGFDDIHCFCSFLLLILSIEQQPYSNILPALQLPYILPGRAT